MSTTAIIADAAIADGAGAPHVLLVDENPANLLALEAILAPLGCLTIKASSGEQTLEHLLHRKFALVLMEVRRGGMDGFEAAALIRSRASSREAPIIFVTAMSRDDAHVSKGYALGAADYLLRPIDPEILRVKVAYFIDLFRKEERLRAQAALFPLPVWNVDADGTIRVVNRAWEKYSGLTLERAGNLLTGGFLHPDDATRLRAQWNPDVRAPSSFDFVGRIRRNDGEFRWHLIHAAADASADTARAWVVTATDNHEQKLAHDAADAANRMKDEFLATVSHELRTPLNAILGWTRMLREGSLDSARAARALETIERNAVTQTDLVNDVLDVSRIISGKLELQFGALDLEHTVRDAVETMLPEAQRKGVRLEWRADRWRGDRFVGDRRRLEQVILNLLTNAVKFTKKGGLIELELSSFEGHAEIVVRDQGQGISPAFLTQVFDRFRQADTSPARAHAGLGLGLAIVRHIVVLHDGQIRAESAGLEQGATFTVTLPMSPATSSAAPTPWFASSIPEKRDSRAAARLDGLHILFVEDQADAREVVAEMLAHYGARVTAVETAAEALDAVRRHIPDALVSDIGLPHHDGYALIRDIRALPPEEGGRIPAVAVSGYARAEDQRRALAEGFHTYLVKPVDVDGLVALIAKLAGAPSSK